MKIRHIIFGVLCIVVMLAGWHDARGLLPLLPYVIAAARHIVPDTRAALMLCKDGDEHD